MICIKYNHDHGEENSHHSNVGLCILFSDLHCSIQRFNPVEIYATYKSMVNKHIKHGDNLMISVLIFGRKFEISIILSI